MVLLRTRMDYVGTNSGGSNSGGGGGATYRSRATSESQKAKGRSGQRAEAMEGPIAKAPVLAEVLFGSSTGLRFPRMSERPSIVFPAYIKDFIELCRFESSINTSVHVVDRQPTLPLTHPFVYSH